MDINLFNKENFSLMPFKIYKINFIKSFIDKYPHTILTIHFEIYNFDLKSDINVIWVLNLLMQNPLIHRYGYNIIFYFILCLECCMGW